MTALTYLICATPRSGSTLLSFGLGSTKLAGNPNEYLDANVVLNWSQQLGFSVRSYTDYLQQLIAATRTPNRVFGAKIMWQCVKDTLSVYAATVPELAALPLHEQIAVMLHQPRYIYITRKDKLRQAISLVKAAQTNIWIQWSGSAVQKAAPAAEPTYHPAAIEEQLNTITTVEYTWQSFFRIAGVEPYTVVYEDLVERYDDIILDILRYLQIDIPPGFRVPPPATERQADSVSEAWYERFQTEPKTAAIYQNSTQVHEFINKRLLQENEALRLERDQLLRNRNAPNEAEVKRLTQQNRHLSAELEYAQAELNRLRAQPTPYVELMARAAYRKTVPERVRLRLRALRQRRAP
jgi:LPS sulfotransferase NodH